MSKDQDNTLGDVELGGSLGRHDAKRADLEKGRFAAGPEGNYEAGSHIPPSPDSDGLNTAADYPKSGTRHQGFIQPDGYEETHGVDQEYGFLRRPSYKRDIEPN